MTDNQSAMMGYAMDELRRRGVPEENIRAAAAHLVGQAQMESGINPNATHDGGTGYGIYGAGHDRRDAMLAYLKNNGYAPNSLEGQTRYMAQEATSGQYPTTRAILFGATPGNFARDTNAITADFESPRVINDRVGAVQSAYGAPMSLAPDAGAAMGGQVASTAALDPASAAVTGATSGAASVPVAAAPAPSYSPFSMSGILNAAGIDASNIGGTGISVSDGGLKIPGLGTITGGSNQAQQQPQQPEQSPFSMAPIRKPLDMRGIQALTQQPRLGLLGV